MERTEEALASVGGLYQQGKYLQAYAASVVLGPLQEWRGPKARLLAGRLANVLGAPRLGRVLHWTAWRESPNDASARYFWVLDTLVRRGPWRAWRLLERHGELPTDDPALRADWCALRAHVLAAYRDFENADQWIAKAASLAPDRPWIHVERAVVLEAEDRPVEALEAVQQALNLWPWYRPAVQAMGYYLVQLNRDEEAVELLTEAAKRLECGDLLQQLAALQTELERFDAARATLASAEQYLPLLSIDKPRPQALLAQRSNAAYLCGDFSEAPRLAEQVESPFFKELTKRLHSRRPTQKRVLLPVGFVRQHHITCAPATLSALSRFWGRPAEHLNVAERICYNGTPSASERRWAEENGFLAREFRITWDSIVALIDRGLPFTFTTIYPTHGHLQAVIGYDECRGTFLVRDPTERHFVEYCAELTLEQFRASGPRGMVMVPLDRADLLASIELPDAELYDELYRLERALQDHCRDEAAIILARMAGTAPDHRLTIMASVCLASYDADFVTQLQSVDRLLDQFTDDPVLLVTKLNCLNELGRREDRLALLERLSHQRQCEPLFWRRYASELQEDARQHSRILALLRRALRYEPVQAEAYQLLANVLWNSLRREEALTFYRFAACLDDKNEGFVRTYFIAARSCGQTDKATRMLEDRFQRFGDQSSLPARSLCWAYEQLEDTRKLFVTLDAAIPRRPQDGDLLLFAADACGRYGKHDEAADYLERSRGKCRHVDWLRTAASLALYQGDLPTSLEHWRRVTEIEPLARDAHSAVASLLADIEGTASAIEHLQQAVARFPYSHALGVLLIEMQRGEASTLETIVRRFLEYHPADPWARRELSIALLRQGEWEAASTEAELAHQLEPNHPAIHMIRGRLYESQGRSAEAKEAFRKSIRLSVDYDPAINALVAACDTQSEREAELRFIYQELERQVIFGDGLLAFRKQAATTLAPQELLGILRAALLARPDLWHAHAALSQQLTSLNQTEEAFRVAQEAVERFPLLPRMWYELAAVCAARMDNEGEAEALGHALQINPSWSDASQKLAEVHRRQGNLPRARTVLEQAIAREPRNATTHGLLAEVLWEQDQRDAAVERLLHAVRLAPDYDWAWRHLRDWTAELRCPETAVNAARELTHTRPKEARAWLILAEVLRTSPQWEECLAALDHVFELNPRCVEAHDLRAVLLADRGRFQEALDACRPKVFRSCRPLMLQARAADIEARRGNLTAAIRQMCKVVSDDPAYFWGWWRLADWYRQTSQEQAYLNATQELVRLAPQEAIAWGYRGDARRQVGERQGAIEDFRHALALDPHYSFAVQSLLDMHVDDCDWLEAIRTLHMIAPPLTKEAAILTELHEASQSGDRNRAIDSLRSLCRQPLEDLAPLRIALGIMRQKRWTAKLAQVLGESLEEDTASPTVGRVWVDLCIQNHQWRYCAQHIRKLSGRREVWLAANQQFLTALAQAKRIRALRGHLDRYGDLLRADLQTWAFAGDLLLKHGQERDVIRWMGDWHAHDHLEAGMLFPLAFSLWKTKRYAELVQVTQHALALPPDNLTPYLAVFLALEQLRVGHLDHMRELVLGQVPTQLNDYYQVLHAMLMTVADVVWPTENGQTLSYRTAKHQLQVAMGTHFGNLATDTFMRRVYYLCQWRLARHYRRFLSATWARLELLCC